MNVVAVPDFQQWMGPRSTHLNLRSRNHRLKSAAHLLLIEVEPSTKGLEINIDSRFDCTDKIQLRLLKIRYGVINCEAHPFFVLAGPNVIESEQHILHMAKQIKSITSKLGLPLVFKSSFDKANRTSSKSFRRHGLAEGLKILEKVKITYDLPIVTDVHEFSQCEAVGRVADIIQIPAFLPSMDIDSVIIQPNDPVEDPNLTKGKVVNPDEGSSTQCEVCRGKVQLPNRSKLC
ncbi:hypothetical protein L2E82_10741 [Cichorium intybus]|uniref:Uncharacterized protein n=1 Tax=Cichorium intybus TaxID=13427 RepID=A0ACB9GBI5_CICIN|nr:hypothetical protein L2E82_10741 [Cichorium intybus]